MTLDVVENRAFLGHHLASHKFGSHCWQGVGLGTQSFKTFQVQRILIILHTS